VIEDLRLTRRDTLARSLKIAGAGAVAVAATKLGGLQALAPDSTGGLAALGLPALDITLSDSSYDGIPSDTPAGLYLVNFTNNSSAVGYLEFMQLPDGLSVDDMTTLLSGGTPVPDPGADEMASPEPQEDLTQGPPSWYYTTYLAGGAGAAPGAALTFVIDLQAGNYVVWGEDPSAPQALVPLNVTDSGTPSAGAAPEADVVIQEQATDSGFAFGIGNQFTAGTQIVQIDNATDQPHFVEIDTVPDGTTLDAVQALLQSEMGGGTPVSGGISSSDIQSYYFAGTQSGGTTQWHEVDFQPGTYVLACWIADPTNGGVPHAMEGMVNLFVIGGTATPTS